MQFHAPSSTRSHAHAIRQRAFLFESFQEDEATEEPVKYVSVDPYWKHQQRQQPIYDSAPSLYSEPQSLFSESNEVREWDAICWDDTRSVASTNVNETLCAEGVLVNMINDHETIYEAQEDIDTQFILWNIIHHQTCSINQFSACTQFTEKEIQCGLAHLNKLGFVRQGLFDFVISDALMHSSNKPLIMELQRRFGEFPFGSFVTTTPPYNDSQNENVSNSASPQTATVVATQYETESIDYFGTEYETTRASDLSLQSPSTMHGDEEEDAFMADIDEILNEFQKVSVSTPYEKKTEMVKRGVFFYEEFN